jgi:hypothetical protein
MSSVSEESRRQAARRAFISHLVDGLEGALVSASVIPVVAVVGSDEVLSTVSDRGVGSDEEEDVEMESEGFRGLDVSQQVAAIHCDEEVGVLSGDYPVWSGIEGEGNGALEGGGNVSVFGEGFSDSPVLGGKRSGAGGAVRVRAEVGRVAPVSLVGRGHRLREKFGGGNPCSRCSLAGMVCVSSELFLLVIVFFSEPLVRSLGELLFVL